MFNHWRPTHYALALSCVALVACGDQANLLEPDGGVAGIAEASFLLGATAGLLNDGEEAHLSFMRSEEKLARDVYLTLDGIYPEQPVFYRIAKTAEQTHTDKVLDILLTFGLDDPEPATLPGTLPPTKQIGVFENPYFAEYFREKFLLLIGKAEVSLLEALKVGALIEELDMKDINYCNGIIYDVFGFPEPLPDYCGLTVTDVRALENTLGNLLAGSENHLCAFISRIGPMSDGCYKAQYLEQDEVWDIIGAQCPRLSDYLCVP